MLNCGNAENKKRLHNDHGFKYTVSFIMISGLITNCCAGCMLDSTRKLSFTRQSYEGNLTLISTSWIRVV